MTARDIQRRLIYDLHRRNFVVPNFTPSGWFECDVFEITKAGFFREYEIKLSRSDFFADANKFKEKWQFDFTPGQPSTSRTVKEPTKHSQLASGRPSGPCRFWFVVPLDLVKVEEVPAWAGLMTCYTPEGNEKKHIMWRVVLNTVKQAPVLHRRKIDPAIRRQALENCYYRYHDLLR